MKVLLLDAGNTRLKWALLDKGQMGGFGSCRHGGEDLARSLASHWAPLPTIDRVLLASVAGALFDTALQHVLKELWGLQAERLVSPAVGSGIVNAYAEPQRLGIDRWLALVAARRLAAGPVCVVDCGTTVTIDRLDAEGCHQGGLILPGLAMVMQALSAGTDSLSGGSYLDDPRFDGHWAEQAVAGLMQDTASAVTAGILTTLVATIDRVINDTNRDAGLAECVMTGGDGRRLQPLLAMPCHLRPHLVLEGMAVLAEEMK
jgi:type III pantothenate kinase